MPQDTQIYILFAGITLFALGLVAYTIIRIWNDWIGFKRAELTQPIEADIQQPNSFSRIEVADLRERVRKLEAIAAGIDL